MKEKNVNNSLNVASWVYKLEVEHLTKIQFQMICFSVVGTVADLKQNRCKHSGK